MEGFSRDFVGGLSRPLLEVVGNVVALPEQADKLLHIVLKNLPLHLENIFELFIKRKLSMSAEYHGLPFYGLSRDPLLCILTLACNDSPGQAYVLLQCCTTLMVLILENICPPDSGALNWALGKGYYDYVELWSPHVPGWQQCNDLIYKLAGNGDKLGIQILLEHRNADICRIVSHMLHFDWDIKRSHIFATALSNRGINFHDIHFPSDLGSHAFAVRALFRSVKHYDEAVFDVLCRANCWDIALKKFIWFRHDIRTLSSAVKSGSIELTSRIIDILPYVPESEFQSVLFLAARTSSVLLAIVAQRATANQLEDVLVTAVKCQSVPAVESLLLYPRFPHYMGVFTESLAYACEHQLFHIARLLLNDIRAHAICQFYVISRLVQGPQKGWHEMLSILTTSGKFHPDVLLLCIKDSTEESRSDYEPDPDPFDDNDLPHYFPPGFDEPDPEDGPDDYPDLYN